MTVKQTASDFLGLDTATLPQAQWQDSNSLSAKCGLDPWARVRLLAAGEDAAEDVAIFGGDTVWLTADAPGWRGRAI